MGKFAVIGIIVALGFFAYLLLKDDNQGAAGGVTEGGTESAAIPVPAPVPEEPAVPVSFPAEDRIRSLEPDPEPIDKGVREEPETVADADDEPEEPEPEPEASENLEPGVPELRERAIGLIGDTRRKRDKELADNASALHFSLSALSRDAEPDVLLLVDELKEDIVDHRIPLIDGVYGLPDKMADAFKDSLAKEELIDGRYLSDLTRIRDAYATRLKDAAADASDSGLKMRLLAQAAEAADLDAWIALLAPQPERVVRKSFRGVVGSDGGGFAGNWDIHAQGKIERWIGHGDGRVEIVGKKWEANWVIMGDGTLEIRWGDGKKPYEMKRDDEGWEGKTSFGHKVKFTRGDW